MLITQRLYIKYVLLFAGLVSGVLLANGLLDIWFSYREQKDLLIRIQGEQAQSAAAKISQFVKEIESQLAWTTHVPWTTSGLESRQLEALRLLRQVPPITELTLLDAFGREQLKVSRVAMDAVGSQIDRSNETAFVAAMQRKVYYGPVYFREESEPYMTLAVAGARREAGISIAEVNLKFIWEVISQIKVGERGHAYVIDAQGRLVAHPDISLVLSNFAFSHLSHLQTARAAEATVQSQPEPVEGIRGERVLAAHAAIRSLDWYVLVELPITEAYAPIHASVLRSGALLLAALVFAILAGLLFARRLTLPIRALQTSAEKIGSGDLSQRISIATGDELEALGDQFNRMAARLQESYATLERRVEERTHQLEMANMAKSRFLAVASHDLRQPLHAFGLFIAQMRTDLDKVERDRVVDNADAAVSDMNELFDALLDISKLDADAVAASPSEFPVADILHRLETNFAGAARQKGLSLRIVPSRAWLRTDFILLERILLNLVSNAVRYTETGGIVVGCRRRAGALRIEVWDSGPGIPADQRQKIFDEFVRLRDWERDRPGGLGLGLAIVERLCRILAHPIELDSIVGKGSRFTVTVPQAPARSVALQQSASTRVPLDVFNGDIVLVVDDDALALDGMGGLLRSWGCRVVAAGSDTVALTSLDGNGPRPDLIICDFHLSDGRTGVDAIELLRRQLGAEIPALLISGDTGQDDSHKAHASGLQVLRKPVSPMMLRTMLVRYLKHGQIAGIG